MSTRFDYVKYDDEAALLQAKAKSGAQLLERVIDQLRCGSSKIKALDKLEECYMWIGKAVRDEQIARNGSAPLQEERKDG